MTQLGGKERIPLTDIDRAGRPQDQKLQYAIGIVNREAVRAYIVVGIPKTSRPGQ